MATVAFVPVRGGSQSIPLKNIKEINGKPLIFWSLVALEKSKAITKVVVATDSEEIKSVVKSFKFKKVTLYNRLPENATHTASTESVMLEYLAQSDLKPQDLFVLVQATNPFMTSDDFTKALTDLKKSPKHQSLISVVRTKRFFWNLNSQPINYNPLRRPRRQDYQGLFMENGAFYVSKVKNILKSKNRLTKPILCFEMPEHSGFEIDEPDDWIICEQLLKKYSNASPRDNKKISKIKLFLSDVDGVLTDAGMYYSENGDELKKFCTYDGMGFKMMKALGLQVGILTAENRNLNRNRAKKLKLDHDFHGVENKLAVLDALLKELNLGYENVCYVGDDVNDIEVLKKVGLPFCPASAQSEVLDIPKINVLKSNGGAGVVREIYNILNSQRPAK